MDRASLQVIWAALLPDHAVVEAGSYSSSAQPGGASEQLATAGMQDSRRLEFLSGRLYARKALAALGREPIDIPIAIDRGPQWPEGVVGSITHTLGSSGGWASAAVSYVATVSSLGIDMECSENLDARALDVVLTSTERAFLMNVPPALRFREASLFWCAKEATLKAARGVTDPSEVEIQLSKSGEQFRATRRSAQQNAREDAWVFEGRTSYSDGFAFAVAYR
jgi:4'-phosphopantetheinyl transferase EntD